MNDNEPILYIVLNKDVNYKSYEKYIIISHMTSYFIDSCYTGDDIDIKKSNLFAAWIQSYEHYGNTVILEASEEEIYENCYEKYDNVMFRKYIDDSVRVNHHLWKLDKPKHAALMFFGIKSEIPKWVKRLPLAK